MKRNNKVIVSCAVTGNAPFNRAHPNFPVTPVQIADASIEAARAGASIVHIHVRDPLTGHGCRTPSLFKEVVDRIRDSGIDIIINLTGGGGALFKPDPANEGIAGEGSDVASVDQRMEHLEICRPEIASLDINTSNQVEAGDDYVYLNTTRTLRAMAERYRAASIKPELEVFSPGDIEFGRHMVEQGLVEGPPMFQFVLGVKWCSPAETLGMYHMRERLPAGAVWGALGIGAEEFPVAAQTILLGGHVRVGLEDNLYLRKGVFATNGELVTRALQIIDSLGAQATTPAEARAILGLPTR